MPYDDASILSGHELDILEQLYIHAGQALHSSDIAKIIGLSESAVKTAILWMADHGYVLRETETPDQRDTRPGTGRHQPHTRVMAAISDLGKHLFVVEKAVLQLPQNERPSRISFVGSRKGLLRAAYNTATSTSDQPIRSPVLDLKTEWGRKAGKVMTDALWLEYTNDTSAESAVPIVGLRTQAIGPAGILVGPRPPARH